MTIDKSTFWKGWAKAFALGKEMRKVIILWVLHHFYSAKP
jgi:hypothetical protein